MLFFFIIFGLVLPPPTGFAEIANVNAERNGRLLRVVSKMDLC